jgi:hypothetical protein
MSYSFNPLQGLMIVQAEVTGPVGTAILRLALDTGATKTLINVAPLVAVGYDPAVAPGRTQITTGSGVEFVPQIPLLQLVALGRIQPNFPILCHTLPPSTTVDGLLGLDFLRGQIVTLDFKNGSITIS